jgi:hypothetical protein
LPAVSLERNRAANFIVSFKPNIHAFITIVINSYDIIACAENWVIIDIAKFPKLD